MLIDCIELGPEYFALKLECGNGSSLLIKCITIPLDSFQAMLAVARGQRGARSKVSQCLWVNPSVVLLKRGQSLLHELGSE